MAAILLGAPAEIRYVTRRNAVFIEPFRDANDLYGFLHLWNWNYFRASKADFAAAGFQPIPMIALPNKMTFGASVLVTSVT